ncbi:hypothetical protein VNO78_21582 [Psophocarpus tetragonolobus]|uniref:Retrotransposon gag domain-containing protein n=1 Tax=Psophocarpus tetragonolobus TaxID=3891 RepID=A0AAN9XII4_PSOTE
MREGTPPMPTGPAWATKDWKPTKEAHSNIGTLSIGEVNGVWAELVYRTIWSRECQGIGDSPHDQFLLALYRGGFRVEMPPRRDARNTRVDSEDLTEMARAMREMGVALTQQAMNHQHIVVDRTTLADFRKNDPPYFRGEYDPEKAEEWVQTLEDIFIAMECPDEWRVSHASFQLQGDAKVWWKATQRMLESRGEIITWDLFKTLFLEKYFPVSARNAKEVEFNKIYQGNMTISKYAAKFESLAKYCRYLQLTFDEEWKCRKFEEGLRYEIKRIVTPLGIQSFPNLMDKCKTIEDMDRIQRSRNVGNFIKGGTTRGGPMHKGKVVQPQKPYSRPS